MQEKESACAAGKYHWLMKLAVVLIAACGAGCCVWWFPYSLSYGGSWDGGSVAQLCLFLACSLPCFVILWQFWRASDCIREGTLFSGRAAGYFGRSAAILFCDLIVFTLVNVVFFLLGRNEWMFLYVFLILCGCAIALLLFLIARFLLEAAKLQEESDGTI